MASSFFDFTVKDAGNHDFPLKQFAEKIVLAVNVASKCGFTKQYKGLEELYKKYHDKGFVIVGFPCNQFGGQEPGTAEEIQEFCELNFGVTFPVLAKIDVNGNETAPVYEFLKKSAPGLLGTEAIKWNFTKFLIGKDGKVIERFAPQTEPADIGKHIDDVMKI